MLGNRKIKLTKLVFIVLMVTSFMSCNNDKEVINELGVVLVPEKLIAYNYSDSTSTSIGFGKKYRLYTSINVSCSTCIFELEDWRLFATGKMEYTFDFYPICYAKDNFEMLKYLFENEDIKPLNFPLFLDADNEFITNNELLVSMNDNITILTDSDNNILLSGNPIHDPELMKEYVNLLNK
jgi:hypothetical protein